MSRLIPDWGTSSESFSTKKRKRHGTYRLFRTCCCPIWWKRTWRVSVCNPRRKNKTRSRFGTVSSKCQATNQLSLMWLVNSASRRVYTVFKNPRTKGIPMKTKKFVGKVAEEPGEAKGAA